MVRKRDGGRTGTGRNGTFAVSSEMQPATAARGYRAKTAISPRKSVWARVSGKRERGQEMGRECFRGFHSEICAHDFGTESGVVRGPDYCVRITK